jgi:vacuolar-type H+-ATPase subunit H
MRIVHKAETDAKTEVRKCQLRYESQLAQRSRDMERRLEDLEDKLNLAQDELEEHRHKTERL